MKYSKELHDKLAKKCKYFFDGNETARKDTETYYDIQCLLDEIEKLHFIIEDYREGIAKTLEDRCPSDERHCGCVPILRNLIKRLVEDGERLAHAEGIYQDDDWQLCVLCSNASQKKYLVHKPDCPITLHRALMKEVTNDRP